MKAIFVAYNQAYNDEVILLLEKFGQRGFTAWEEIQGRGGIDGEPHLGNHAWPVQNNALLTVVDDALVAPVLEALKEVDRNSPDLGLRAFTWNIESAI